MSSAFPSGPAGNFKVGMIGLGSMGVGMAQSLVRAGFSILAWDLYPAARERAAALGVPLATDGNEAFSQADFFVFSLPSAREVEAVIDQGLSLMGRADGRRAIVIDTSTSEPDVSRALAEKLSLLGHDFLDAPVSGGPQGAVEGKLTMMIGGLETAVARAQPVIDAMAAKPLYVGPSGAGNIAKLVNNMIVAVHMVAAGEGLKLAQAAGLDPAAALGVVNAASGRSFVSEVHFPTFVLPATFNSGFTMGLMRKDLHLALELAGRSAVDLPVAVAVNQLWKGSKDYIPDTDDFTRMGDFRPVDLSLNAGV